MSNIVKLVAIGILGGIGWRIGSEVSIDAVMLIVGACIVGPLAFLFGYLVRKANEAERRESEYRQRDHQQPMFAPPVLIVVGAQQPYYPQRQMQDNTVYAPQQRQQQSARPMQGQLSNEVVYVRNERQLANHRDNYFNMDGWE